MREMGPITAHTWHVHKLQIITQETIFHVSDSGWFGIDIWNKMK